jgi:hypothetical protein
MSLNREDYSMETPEPRSRSKGACNVRRALLLAALIREGRARDNVGADRQWSFEFGILTEDKRWWCGREADKRHVSI